MLKKRRLARWKRIAEKLGYTVKFRYYGEEEYVDAVAKNGEEQFPLIYYTDVTTDPPIVIATLNNIVANEANFYALYFTWARVGRPKEIYHNVEIPVWRGKEIVKFKTYYMALKSRI